MENTTTKINSAITVFGLSAGYLVKFMQQGSMYPGTQLFRWGDDEFQVNIMKIPSDSAEELKALILSDEAPYGDNLEVTIVNYPPGI